MMSHFLWAVRVTLSDLHTEIASRTEFRVWVLGLGVYGALEPPFSCEAREQGERSGRSQGGEEGRRAARTDLDVLELVVVWGVVLILGIGVGARVVPRGIVHGHRRRALPSQTSRLTNRQAHPQASRATGQWHTTTRFAHILHV